MFDLNKSISSWKQTLLNDECFTNDNIAELESHLNEQIQVLANTGLSTEEAFIIAKKRIGGNDELNIEYKKVNTAYINKKRILWMVTGIILMGIINNSLSSINSLSYALAIYLNIDLNTWTYIAYSVQISFLVLLFTVVIKKLKWNKENNLIEKLSLYFNNSKIFTLKLISLFFIFMNLIFAFLYFYGFQWVNAWQKYYVQTEIYKEHLATVRLMNPIVWYVTTFAVIAVFIFAYKYTYKPEVLTSK